MRNEFHHEAPGSRPLVVDVEASDPSRLPGDDRDEAILNLLREKLKGRHQGNVPDTVSPGHRGGGSSEDKYEPQRLGRKICWQYDSTARKVPLLRRPYI